MKYQTIPTKDLSRQEWLELRCCGIGGSDASVIMRRNPYRSILQLWEEKTGQIGVNDNGNEFTYWGNIMEPILRKEFMKRTGLKVRQKHSMILHPDYPYLFADLDGIVTDENGEKCIFEAKTVSQYKEEQWDGRIPDEYMYQVQHYMAVCGMDKAYVAGLVGGNHLVFNKVFRDEDIIRELLAAETDFWNNYVLANRRPEADGTKATTDYLKDKYSKSVSDCIQLEPSLKAVIEQYDEVSDRLSDMETQKAALANQIKAALQEHESGEVDGRIVSWKSIQKVTFDSKRFSKDEPELYARYQKDSSYRRLSVA